MPMEAINDLTGAVEEIVNGVDEKRARELIGAAFLAGINCQQYRQGLISGVIDEPVINEPVNVVSLVQRGMR